MNAVAETPPPGFQDRARRRRLWVVAAVLLLAVGVSLLGAKHRAQEGFFGLRLFPEKDAYNFKLTDAAGRPFELASLRGKAVLLAFGFTHCPNFCPSTLADFAAVRNALAPAAKERLQLLFVSVDPGRDTPAALRAYVPYFDDSLIGLTGAKAEIDRATEAFGASYEIVHQPGYDPDVYTVNHSTFAYLINPRGRVEVIYDYDKLKETEKVRADVERVLNEPGN